MLRNWTEFLSPADIQEIHNTSIKLLANVGVRFPEDKDSLGVHRSHHAGRHAGAEKCRVQRCRTESWQPVVTSRVDLATWQENGRPDVLVRARQRWQRLLAEHRDPPLDDVTTRQLQAFMEKDLA